MGRLKAAEGVNSFQRVLLVFFVFGFVGLGCDRSSQDNNSTLRLEFGGSSSKALAIGDSKLVRVMINVTTLGKQISCIYDENDSGLGAVGPCGITVTGTDMVANLRIPSGGKGLVQVLVAYEPVSASGSSGDISFFYGADPGVDFSQAQAEANIQLAAEVTTTNMGAFVGRIVGPSGVPQTGILEIRFKPKDHPSLIIDVTEIYNGWVSGAVMFDGVDFEYVVKGESLMNGPSSMATFTSLVAAQPVGGHQHLVSVDNTSSGDGPDTVFYGFIGADSNDKKVCVAPGLAMSTSQNDCQDLTLLDPTKLVGLYDSHLLVFNQNGEPEIAGFQGAFGALPSLGVSKPKLLRLTTLLGSQVAVWRYMPGVADSIGGVRVFYSPAYNETNFAELRLSDRDRIKCGALFRNTLLPGKSYLGYTFLADVASPKMTYTLAGTANDTDGHVLICPYRKGILKTSYSIALSNKDTGGSSNGSNLPYVRIEGFGNPVDLSAGTCIPVTFNAYTYDGSTASAYTITGGDLNFTLAPDNGGTFHPVGDSSCGGSVTVGFIADGSSQSGTFYYKVPASPHADVNFFLSFTTRSSEFDYSQDSETAPVSF